MVASSYSRQPIHNLMSTVLGLIENKECRYKPVVSQYDPPGHIVHSASSFNHSRDPYVPTGQTLGAVRGIRTVLPGQ